MIALGGPTTGTGWAPCQALWSGVERGLAVPLFARVWPPVLVVPVLAHPAQPMVTHATLRMSAGPNLILRE
jgi:hypothetical protein